MKLRILVCSGNLGNALPDPDSIAAWLPKDGCYSEVVENPYYPLPDPEERDTLLQDLHVKTISDPDRSPSESEDQHGDYFDIIVIGMQEATFSVKEENGEIKPDVLPIVQPLIDKAQKKITKVAEKGFATVTTLTGSTDHTVEKKENVLTDWMKAQDSNLIQQLFADRCPSYDFAVRFQRGQMRLEILVRKELEASVLSVRAQNTGLVNLAANKGGIVGELLVGGTTRITFCTAHLEAHEGMEKYHFRCQMLTDILHGTADDSIPGIKYDMSLKSHFMFVLGDLNFRTEIAHVDKQGQRALVDDYISNKNWRELNKADELFRALRDKDVAAGFRTLPCYFPPTFKVQRGEGFAYVDNRRPSYTDRILWKCGNLLDSKVMPTAYEAVEKFVTSDHKPIRGAFEIEMNQFVKLREPRMLKRESVFRGLIGLGANRRGNVLRQSLHIFISNLKCNLHKRNGKGQNSSVRPSATLQPLVKPDPFVAFISFPKRLVKEERSTWQKFEGYFHLSGNLRTLKNEDGTATRTAAGWPRTKKLTATEDPDWSGEEIHLKVKSHNKDGVPLNHTGALLYFSVFNAASLELNMIGTFPMNLANLCATAQSARRSRLRDRSSIYLKDAAMVDMTSFHINEPLCKNGRETGWITCDIDACWLDDDANASKSVKSMRQSVRGSKMMRLDRGSSV